MKKLSYAALGAAALSLAATPAIAEAGRTSAPVASENNLADGPTITALLVVAALVAGVVIFADGDEPVSA